MGSLPPETLLSPYSFKVCMNTLTRTFAVSTLAWSLAPGAVGAHGRPVPVPAQTVQPQHFQAQQQFQPQQHFQAPAQIQAPPHFQAQPAFQPQHQPTFQSAPVQIHNPGVQFQNNPVHFGGFSGQGIPQGGTQFQPQIFHSPSVPTVVNHPNVNFATNPNLVNKVNPVFSNPNLGNPAITQFNNHQTNLFHPTTNLPLTGNRPVNLQIPGQFTAGPARINPTGGNAFIPGLGGNQFSNNFVGRRLPVAQVNNQIRDSRLLNLQNQVQFSNQNGFQRQNFYQKQPMHADWQHWNQDYYSHHSNWHHGCWNNFGNYNSWQPWNNGTTIWGLNRMGYWFGCNHYYNPYYVQVAGVPAYLNYGVPLAAPSNAVVSAEAMQLFDLARAAFQQGQYDAALQAVNNALALMPSDGLMHQFRGLVLFAMGDYHGSAAAVHAVLAVSPGWDWTTLSGLYPLVDIYTQQLRNLEAFVQANPTAADAEFLLAYHYLTCGYTDPALNQLRQVVALQPNDALAVQLLNSLMSAQLPQNPQPLLGDILNPNDAPNSLPQNPLPQSPLPSNPLPPAGVSYEAAQFVGGWRAQDPTGATFDLTVSPQSEFNWTLTSANGERQEVKGVLAAAANSLAMEPYAGGVMTAEISEFDNQAFTFKMVGSAPTEPGLRFARVN